MDEPFHLEQTISIAKLGSQSPHVPDLTTLTGFHWLMSLLPSSQITHLRFLGSAVAMTLQVTACVVSRVSPLILLYPANFLYNSLLYTDGVSTGLVVLSWALYRRNWLVAGIASGLAVLVRQSNIAWAFALFLKLICVIYRKRKGLQKSISLSDLVPVIPFLVTGVGFLWFLVNNNFQVVLGHHEHHSTSLHLAQIVYLGVLLLGCKIASSSWRNGRDLPLSSRYSWLCVAFLAVCAYCRVAHPFVLSDNRHLTFYLWKYFLRSTLFSVSILPVFAFMGYKTALKAFGFGDFFIWGLASSLSVVPSPLFEVRYFNPSILIVLMEAWRTEGLRKSSTMFSVVNVIVLTLFCGLYKGIHFMY